VSIGNGLTLVKKPAPRDARALPIIGDSTSPDALDDFLLGRAERLLETRALQMPLSALLGMNQQVESTGKDTQSNPSKVRPLKLQTRL